MVNFFIYVSYFQILAYENSLSILKSWFQCAIVAVL